MNSAATGNQPAHSGDRPAGSPPQNSTAAPRPNSTPRKVRSGCGAMLAMCVISCVLVVANGILVAIGYAWIASIGPRVLRNPKLTQACLFLGPVVLLFIQWWLVDLLRERYRSRRLPSRRGPTTRSGG